MREPIGRRGRQAIAVAAALAVLAAGCTTSDGQAEGPGGSRSTDLERQGSVLTADDVPARPLALPDDLLLASFSACDDFLAHIKEQALELVGPWGLDGGGGAWRGGMVVEDADEAGADDGAAPTAAGSGVEYSGTNVQEAGVDEPDMIKTDGSTMYVIAQGELRILDVRGDVPEELATLPLSSSWDAKLFLDGDRLLVTSSSAIAIPFAGEVVRPADIDGGWGTTSITLVDVSNPRAPQVTERLTIDGWTVSARMVDGVARVVVRTEQGHALPWVYPEGSGLRAERRATEANRQIIERSQAEDWLPYLVHRTADGREREGVALACDRVARPTVFSGLGVLSVLTIDVADGDLVPGDEAVGVLTGGDTVYASPERLYVATTQYQDPALMDRLRPGPSSPEVRTAIHAFDTSDPATTDYLGSGEVRGNLLSQWAMSEYEGLLRVASTDGDPWGWGSGDPSESYVTVLELRGEVLRQIGQVGGLGKTETIHAVRFIDDVGYVVTFRQTDPLYTVDLSDPTNPVVRGELKILGYSAYLHPVGDHLLLGVGQDADEQGMLKGTQISLFDVADLDDPIRIDTADLGEGGSSEVEYDHHAFLHWPATGLTVVPFVRWYWDETGRGEDEVLSGAATFTAARDGGIDKGRVLTHTAQLEGVGDLEVDGYRLDVWDLGWFAQIRRSQVIGDRLFTISEAGVAVHDLETLEDTGWLRFS